MHPELLSSNDVTAAGRCHAEPRAMCSRRSKRLGDPAIHVDRDVRKRDDVLCELDYGFRRARLTLGRAPSQCRGYMLRTSAWKYVHWEGLRPQLFDLARDPSELTDLGGDAALQTVRSAMQERLLDKLATLRHRITLDDAEMLARTDTHRARGIHIGIF